MWPRSGRLCLLLANLSQASMQRPNGCNRCSNERLYPTTARALTSLQRETCVRGMLKCWHTRVFYSHNYPTQTTVESPQSPFAQGRAFVAVGKIRAPTIPPTHIRFDPIFLDQVRALLVNHKFLQLVVNPVIRTIH